MKAPVGKSGPLIAFRRSAMEASGVVDQQLDRLGHLAEVVGRNVGGHAHGDAAGAVDQEVGDLGGEDGRLLEPVVEVGLEVDGVLVDVLQHGDRDPGEPRLGIAIGRGRIAVHRAEVALPVDQRIPERELLHHPDQRVVDRLVAMRVVLAQHVAYHRRRLLVRPPGHQSQLVHRIQDSPVDRLEPVPHIRQRPGDDDAHRVVDERLLHLLFDQAGQDAFARIGCGHSLRVLGGQGVRSVGREPSEYSRVGEGRNCDSGEVLSGNDLGYAGTAPRPWRGTGRSRRAEEDCHSDA